jgi:hypothetical protein
MYVHVYMYIGVWAPTFHGAKVGEKIGHSDGRKKWKDGNGRKEG